MWVNGTFPNLRPMSIPHHGGKDLSPRTKSSILNQLEEEDVAAWEDKIGKNGSSNGGHGVGHA